MVHQVNGPVPSCFKMAHHFKSFPNAIFDSRIDSFHMMSEYFAQVKAFSEDKIYIFIF